jgi:hypothetical protein
MAKEWANKDKYHPSDGVLEPHVQMPRAKASVRTVRAWGERKAVGGAATQVTPVRPVWAPATQLGLEVGWAGWPGPTSAQPAASFARCCFPSLLESSPNCMGALVVSFFSD